jgi:hypothetical protein
MKFLGFVDTPHKEEQSHSLLIQHPVVSSCTISLLVGRNSFDMYVTAL